MERWRQGFKSERYIVYQVIACSSGSKNESRIARCDLDDVTLGNPAVLVFILSAPRPVVFRPLIAQGLALNTFKIDSARVMPIVGQHELENSNGTYVMKS